jgi:phage-related protein
MAGPIRIAILADARQATKTVSTFGDKVGRSAGVATVGLGLLAAGAVGAARAAEEVASANAKVANILGNMGEGAATDRVLKLAEATEALTGVDDVLIKGAQAKLASFESVAKSADVAGGAFDRATLAAIDLAAAGFGSAEGNAAQLGKALQDPIKGLTALTRSGVSFTAQEKEKIKALTESGKASQAQDLILKAVEKQVGGTAAASAKSSDKIAASFENIAESVGGLLLPILNKVTPVIQSVTDTLAANPGVILGVAGAVAVLAGGILVLNGILKAVAIVQKAAAIAQVALNVAMTANPIGIIIVLVAALVAGLVWFFTQTKLGKAIVTNVWKGIQSAISGVVSWWTGTAIPFLRAGWLAITTIFQIGKAKVTNFLNGVLTVIQTVWKYSPLGIIVSNWGRIIAFVKGIPGRVSSALGSLAGRLVSAGLSIINGFLSGLRAGFENVKNFVGGIGSWIAAHKGPRQYDLGLLVKNGGWIMQGLRSGIEGDLPALKRTLGRVADTVAGADMGAVATPGVTARARLAALATASTVAPAVAAGGAEFVISFAQTGDPIFDALLSELRKRILVNGGSAQKYLGA